MKRIHADKLLDFAKEVLLQVGVPGEDAQIISRSLVQANLEGIDSHGISRLPIYVKRMMENRVNVKPRIRVKRSGCVLRVDGDRGLGQVVSYRSVEAGIPVAKKLGMAGIFVKNSNHNGTSAFYCQQAIRAGMILVAMTNSPPGIAPTGGKKPYLGTNPIAFGFPTPSGPPLIVDMSSSMVARGKIILAAKQGEEIPSGWALDEEGIETTSPNAALKGSVLPLGGAKGYALATAIEMFSGVLSGAAFGTNVASIYDDQAGPANVGHHFILYHLEHWMPMKVYYERITRFLEELKAIPPANKGTEITYPGERRYRRYLERKAKEIPLSDVVIAELNQLAFECRLPQSL